MITEKEQIKRLISDYLELHIDWEQNIFNEIKDIHARTYLETMTYHESYFILKQSEDFREDLLVWCDHDIWNKYCTEPQWVSALHGIDDPIAFVAFAKEWMKYSQITPLIKDIFEFVNQVYESQQPRLSQIGIIHNTDKDQPEKIPMISLWAGVGDMNPIQRINHFRQALQKIASIDPHEQVSPNYFIGIAQEAIKQ